jgi:hypothetical protein
MPIKRYLSEENLNRIKNDLDFLIKFVINSYGEYDLAIRDNYLNLYYKGCSIGKIQPIKDGNYLTTIHKFFFDKTIADRPIHFTKINKGEYWSMILRPEYLHTFFQKKHIIAFSSRVNERPSGELAFEQAIMTDNLGREDIIIIDRQITDSELERKRLDLLALKKADGIKYTFLLLEVKLGKNNELKGEVNDQLDCYLRHIRSYFNDYKDCYEKHFLQKIELGLLSSPEKVEIIEPIEGMILIGSYSGIAQNSIDALKAANPNISIKHFKYAL